MATLLYIVEMVDGGTVVLPANNEETAKKMAPIHHKAKTGKHSSAKAVKMWEGYDHA
jgi:hypothetical protein